MAEDKQLAMKDAADNALATPGSFGVKGFEGFDTEDIIMPSVRLVQAMSRDVDLATGGKAEVGTFYHKGKQESYKDLEVVIFFSKKMMQHDEKKDRDYAVARVLMAPVDDLESPFVMFFTKYGYWNGWRPFLNMVIGQKLEAPWMKTVKISSVLEKNDKGEWYEPRLSFGKDTTKAQRELAEQIFEKFGATEFQSEEDEESSEETPF